MQDVQSMADHREVPLEHVGITKLALPIRIKEKAGSFQHVSALVNLFVEVPSRVKGTHLSRLVESTMTWADRPVASGDILHLLEDVRTRVGSFSAEVDLGFGYFLERRAPVTERRGVMRYDSDFRGRLDDDGFTFLLGVRVPVTTLCPCSKAISEAGAHNQRSLVSVQISYEDSSFVWLEDLIEWVESQGSCPIFPVLKRPDEKYVTERAYDNPKFVEDVVRDVILVLKRDVPGLVWLSVECESYESIHGHNAYAAAQERIELVRTRSSNGSHIQSLGDPLRLTRSLR